MRTWPDTPRTAFATSSPIRESTPLQKPIEAAPAEESAAIDSGPAETAPPKLYLPRRRHPPKRLNLALQGGGAHGAFTWGVLDRLLELNEYKIDGISGTSAGAVNAVALAAGLMEAGTDGARKKLEQVWRAVNAAHSHYMPMHRPLDGTAGQPPQPRPTATHVFMSALSRVLSPYEFNPLEIDPLRRILADQIDFDGLRRHQPVRLFVNATEAKTGRGRIFSADEISIDAVLASACLPAYRHAVRIDGRYYWDGGYSANPPLVPLIEKCEAADTLLVRLTPEHAADVPTAAKDIQGNVNRIMFSQPLRKEIELIETVRRLANGHPVQTDPLALRVLDHRFHMLDGARYTAELAHDSHLQPHWDVLAYLNQRGRKATTNWLRRHKKSLGQKSTVDLAKKFL
ncbi:MAG: patatin-like phospholipase family protein [Rhodospirillales bacterium]|nr:patatin-like phospholipase family protein [Rhodospirillales bacterium]MBO6787139.1 patatin-like phospholipase family protein [Rhodospirillales bacterium]